MKYFYKNLAYEKCYDENSFVAGLMDYFEWSDEKYWLLEKSNYLISPLRPSISDRVNRLRSLILTVSLDDDKFFYTDFIYAPK